MFRRRQKENREKDLYFKYAEKMYLLCLRYVHNADDAEEIMHNGFIKVFKNVGNFKEQFPGSFEKWMKKIMINESLMFLRKQDRNIFLSIDNYVEHETEETITSDVNAEYLIRLLQELPVGYRTVFNLFAIEGYDHREIAEMLEITESTSRTQLLKARKMLQQKLKMKNPIYERSN